MKRLDLGDTPAYRQVVALAVAVVCVAFSLGALPAGLVSLGWALKRARWW